jgi:hypothetical protein
MRLRTACTTAALAVGLLLSAMLPAAASTTDGVVVAGDVWLDLDSDGTRDDADPGRVGVAVSLRTSATILDATVTDSDGTWRFANVAPGSYTVVVSPPIDHRITAGEQTVTVEVGLVDILTGPSLGLGTPVASGPDVTVTVRADEASSSDTVFGWMIDVYNLGDSAADGPISVRIVLDGAHAATSASGTGWTCDASDVIVTCATGSTLLPAEQLPRIQLLSKIDGEVGASARMSGTVRILGAFDGAPLNDEASAEQTVGTALAAPDTDGDGTADLSDTGVSALALILLALLALAAGAATVRATRAA